MAGGIGDDADIFDAGNTPEPEPSTQETPIAPSEESQAVSQAIRGMQTSRPASQPPPQSPQPTPGQEQSPGGLLKALLDERDRRQGLERQVTNYQKQEEEARKRQERPPFNDRFWEQPEKELGDFFQERFAPYEDRIRNMQADFDMRIARINYGEEFDEAFQAWFQGVGDLQNPNPQLYWGVMNSPSPGEAIMQWWNGMQERREIGDGGLKAYRERIEREILERHGLAMPQIASPAPTPNPNVERASNGQFTPRHEVRLPTATSRLAPSGRGTPSGSEDGSEEAIFDTGRRK